jgi:serine/threonine protein kinase/Flp pilus assembly protein TadD
MIGETILHYKILEKLGEGGMGIVYKAEDIKLKRLVALKFLPSHITASREELARFNQEAQAAAILNHPNICTIYAIEEGINSKGEKQQFIAMEYVDGTNLSKKIEREPLKMSNAISYAVQIGEALQEAHSNGIVHRDIKSENIMVNSKNQIKVMDFGLAKLKGSIKLTRTSSTVGTLAYMAPEQIQGGEVDARSDIFSFGVVLFEMLTGILPFRGEHDASIMYSILNEEPEPLQKYIPDANSDLIHIINRILEKDPEDRYQSMKDIVIELRRIQKKTGNVSRKILYESAALPKETPAHEINKHEASSKTETLEEKKSSEGISKSSGKKKLLIIGSLVIAAIALIVLGYFLLSGKSSGIVIGKSIAVLPFKNLSSNSSDEYFSDGITEDLTVELSRIGDLKVIARNAVMKFKNSDASIKDIGNELGVSSLLEGSIQKEGNEVRIVAQLVNVNTGEYIWAGTYDKELTQIFAIQSDVSRQIASALKAKLTPEEESRIERKPTDNINAYQYYLKGREYYYRYTKEDNENAIKLFKEALGLDPNYALAYAGLGDCYGQRVYRFGFPEDWLDSSIVVSNKSISIDPTMAEGYKALALAQAGKGWIKKSLETNKKAARLNPNYWPAVGNIGADYMFLGDLANAVYWDNKANLLNPASGLGYALLAYNYVLLTEYSNADKNLKLALNMQPDLTEAYLYYSFINFDHSNFAQSINDCEKILSITPDDQRALMYSAVSYINLGNHIKAIDALKKVPANSIFQVYGNIYLAYIYKKNGNVNAAKNLISASKGKLQKRLSGGSENNFDALYISLAEVVDGNKIGAYKWLNKAVDYGFRDYNQLLNDPVTASIRNDQQFIDIVQNIKNKVKEQQDILTSMNNN